MVAGARLVGVDGTGATTAGDRAPVVTPHPVASSVEELIDGATGRRPFRTSDAKSGSSFERVEIDGERYVLKVMHVDDDWIARSVGDLGCHQVTMWASGLYDTFPRSIDHAVVGAARGFGRNGWGASPVGRCVCGLPGCSTLFLPRSTTRWSGPQPAWAGTVGERRCSCAT